jgi:hypothetical protein
LDKEFFESILVPQVMLYGFLGFAPTSEGFRIDPQLPKDWPEATITRIHLHGQVLDLTARADGSIVIQADRASESPLVIGLPQGKWRTPAPAARVEGRQLTVTLPAGRTEILPVR